MNWKTANRADRRILCLALCCLVMACGNSDAMRAGGAANTASPAAAGRSQGATEMSKADCGQDAIARDSCMIRMILDDVAANYAGEPGGGISRIEAGPGDSFTVFLPKEERRLSVTYEFAVAKDGTITIKDKQEAVKSFGG